MTLAIFALALLFVGYRLADKWWRNSAAYAFKQGEIYWSQKKHATGLKWYLIAVDKGHVAATKKAAEEFPLLLLHHSLFYFRFYEGCTEPIKVSFRTAE